MEACSARAVARYIVLASTMLVCSPSFWAMQNAGNGNQVNTRAPRQRSSRRLLLPGRGAGLATGAVVRLQADELELSNSVYSARGDVQIDYQDVRLTADRIDYNSVTGWVTADGSVSFDSLSEQTHVEGTHGSYNFKTQVGAFDNFHGFTAARVRGRQGTLSSDSPLLFNGRRMERLGENKYRVEHGTVTSCELPNPKWTLSAERVDLEVGGNASLHGATFRLRGIPLFYAPFLTHSTRREGRHSGFLLPNAGKSSRKGYVAGESFFWAVTRSINTTLGAEYYSARGWADHLALDSFPTQRSRLSLQLDGVFDRGVVGPDGVTRINQGGQESHIIGAAESVRGARLGIDATYLSSFLYRLAFKETFAEAINSEIVSTAFAEKQQNGYDLSLIGHRYQNFLSTAPHDEISLASLPAVEWSSADRAPTRLPVYLSWDANAAERNRFQPDFHSGGMQRLDLIPQLTVPLQTLAGGFLATFSVRGTYYSQSLQTPAAPKLFSAANASLERYSGSLDLDWTPPVLEGIFNSPATFLGRRLKHTIEPDVAFHYTEGVRRFNDIIRFDERDILTDTQELDYGITNRLFSRGVQGGARELISWSLRQKYFFDPTFGGALVPGQVNVFLTTALLSPFAFESLARRFSPVSSQVRVSPVANFDGDWRLDYDFPNRRLQGSAFTGHFQHGPVFFDGSHFLVRTPLALASPGVTRAAGQTSFNQLRFATGYGSGEHRGLSVGVGTAYDVRQHVLQYGTLQTTYNWDCCGISVLYRRFGLGTLRRENQFRATFSLANVGNFGNLKRQERVIY